MDIRAPKYSHQKRTGQAFVKLKGRFIYLGKYRTPESRQEYRKVIGEYLAGGGDATARPTWARSASSQRCN